jgi:hypothetical protein
LKKHNCLEKGIEMSIKGIIDKAKQTITGRGEGSVHSWLGENPHADFEQSHPAVNKDEPISFANPEEAGAKKPSEKVQGIPNPYQEPGAAQKGSSQSCAAGDLHSRTGSDPHTEFEQHRPFVNKQEPEAFANPCESGAKKPSEDVEGKPMPKGGEWH